MPLFSAAWLLPISQPPIRDGWVRTEQGRIAAFGARGGDPVQRDAIDLGHVALMPGLVNAHTHLELSWMRGLLPEMDDFPGWIRRVIAHQRAGSGNASEPATAMREAIVEARATGTVLFGDISNTLLSVAPLIDAHASAVVFHELIGFRGERAAAVIEASQRQLRDLPASDSVRYARAGHAPYSVSPALFRAIQSLCGSQPGGRWSVHLGESAAETDFLLDGSGPWRTLLDDLGVWDPAWQAPHCDPVEYLDRLGVLDERVLVVHGVQFGEQALRRLAHTGATLITCPRGNRLTGAGSPPASAFYRSAVRVAVGTDSLASVPDLNMFNELAELRRLAPEVPAARLVESATLNGACALGFESDFGTIDVGKSASLIAVSVPPGVRDVEEYLVHGIAQADIAHLDAWSRAE